MGHLPSAVTPVGFLNTVMNKQWSETANYLPSTLQIYQGSFLFNGNLKQIIEEKLRHLSANVFITTVSIDVRIAAPYTPGDWLSLRSPGAVMTALTLLAAVAAAPALSCKLATAPRYVAPAHLDCVPCEHTGGG